MGDAQRFMDSGGVGQGGDRERNGEGDGESKAEEEKEEEEEEEEEEEVDEETEMTEEDVIIDSPWSALGNEWDNVFSDIPSNTHLHLDTLLWTSFNNMEECSKYPEVMLLDTTHKTNSWGMPFLQVTGTSHFPCSYMFLLCETSSLNFPFRS